MMRLILAFFIFGSVGCASFGKQWKALIGGGEAKEQQNAARPKTTYSRNPNVAPPVYRKYKRTTRQDLANDAHLDSKAGSLWVMEGQGAYYFSQNTVRMVGDPIGIRIEGDPAEQLSAKAGVISKLLKQVEERRRRAAGRGPANAKSEAKPENTTQAGANPAAAQVPQVDPAGPSVGNKDENTEFSVKNVPTRVVERLIDGNYRVRGTQSFMIGSREYKVIVAGIVRAEDFNEQGISSTQLLDANFDIVSSKGAELR